MNWSKHVNCVGLYRYIYIDRPTLKSFKTVNTGKTAKTDNIVKTIITVKSVKTVLTGERFVKSY